MIVEHVGLTVGDLDRSIAFYTAAFGYSVLRKTPVNAYLHLEDELLELMVAGTPASDDGPDTTEAWRAQMPGSPGLNHIGFRVDDLDAAIERIEAGGGRLVIPPYEFTPQIESVAEPASDKLRRAARPLGRRAWRLAVFADPDGALLELVER